MQKIMVHNSVRHQVAREDTIIALTAHMGSCCTSSTILENYKVLNAIKDHYSWIWFITSLCVVKLSDADFGGAKEASSH